MNNNRTLREGTLIKYKNTLFRVLRFNERDKVIYCENLINKTQLIIKGSEEIIIL